MLNEVTARDTYTGDATTTVFAYSFEILAKTDIAVYVDATLKTVDTDYSVSGLGASGGGNVTFTLAPATATKITLLRKQPLAQGSAYTLNEGFPSTRVEKDLDKAIMAIQQLQEELNRAIKLPISETGTAAKTTIPSPTARPLQYFYYDASGNPTSVATVIPTGTPASAFMATVLDDADAAAARATLGVGTGDLASTLVDATGDLLVGTAADTVARMAVGADGTALIGLAAAAAGLAYQSGHMNGVVLIGGKITVTMAANAVTIAIKTDAGNNPSATEPVWVWFRSATLTDGASVLRKITAATSTVISSGSTGGTVSGVASRVYVDVIDNAGTVELGWHQTVSETSLLGFSESALVSTTSEGGAGAADSAGVMYSTTARASVAFRTAGYFESIQSTAGTWASAATVVQQMGPGVRRTGDVVQSVSKYDGVMATGTVVTPRDNTIPQQSTETNIFLTAPSISGSNAVNLYEIEWLLQGTHSVGGHQCSALFQDSTENALKVAASTAGGAGSVQNICGSHTMRVGSTTGTVFKVGAGNLNAGTFTFNGEGGAAQYNATYSSYLYIIERCV